MWPGADVELCRIALAGRRRSPSPSPRPSARPRAGPGHPETGTRAVYDRHQHPLAYRVGLGMADRIAGVIALNGQMPKPAGAPLFQMSAIRRFPVLIGHGLNNPAIPYSVAQRDHRLLYAAGAHVRLVGYPTTHRL